MSPQTKKNIFKTVLIFALSFGIFATFEFAFTNLLGADAYYHFKMAELIRTQGLPQQFPWLYFSFLNENFADQHLLFHFLLIPFTFLPAITGAKFAVCFFGALAAAAFFYLLLRCEIFTPTIWWLFFLFASGSLIFRLHLLRASSLSLFCLFLLLLALFKDKKILPFVVSFLFVWLYGASFILLVVLAVFLIFSFWFRPKTPLLPALSTLLGFALGFAFHPYVGNLFEFLKIQLFTTGLFPNLKVGAEWYPIDELYFLETSGFVIFLALLAGITALILRFVHRQKNYSDSQSTRVYTLLTLSLLFLGLTLKSSRFTEYFVPFALLFAAFTLSPLLKKLPIFDPRRPFKLNKSLVVQIVALSLLCLIFSSVASYNTFRFLEIAREYDQKRPLQSFIDAGNYLKDHTEAGEIVYNVAWDEFPLLFFTNDRDYYISGLDPAFLYAKNNDLADKYQKIYQNPDDIDIYTTISQDFSANYLFITKKYQKLNKNLRADTQFQLVWQDNFAKLYYLPPQ